MPLVVGADGERLAKRHGAVTLEDLADLGVAPERVVGALAISLGMAPAASPHALLDGFDLARVAACGGAPVELADLQRSWS